MKGQNPLLMKTTLQQFLDSLFASKPDDAFIELQAHGHNGENIQRFVTTTQAVALFASSYGKDHNVFFSVCPRERKRGTAQDVQSVPALWVDLDVEQDIEVAFQLPNDIPEPTFFVRSGTPKHYHLYWLLKEPAKPDALTRNIVAGLHYVLKGDATHDLSRRLRLPTTFNQKASPPRVCTIANFEPNNVYDLKIFEHLAKETGEKEMVAVGEPENIDIDGFNLSPRIRSLITEGKESRDASRFARLDGTIDRSRLDMAIATALNKAGLSPDQIHGVFAKYPCSGRYHEISHRVPYIEHTISAAVAAAKKTTVTIDFTLDRPPQAIKRALDACPLPSDGWLKDYVQELDVKTEAPASYHLHAGLCALSALVGARVILPTDVYARYPNLYVMLVGESGVTGKSTAISLSREVVSTLQPEYPIYGDFTTEALTKIFIEYPVLFVCRGELGAITASSAKKYAADVIPVLTELYDGDSTGKLRATVASTKWKHPAVTVLLGSTVSWLRKYMGMDMREAVMGGFFPRFFIVLEKDTGKAIPRAKGLRYIARDLANALFPRLKEILALDSQAPATFTSDAMAMYDAWYVEQRKRDVNLQEAQSSFFARLRTSAIKVAVLLQISIDGSLTVNEDAMKYGIDLCNWHQRKISVFLGNVDPLEEMLSRVSAVIQTRGVATKSEVYKALPGKRSNEIRDIISLLVDRGFIEPIDLRIEGQRGRPASGFRWLSVDAPKSQNAP
jgi:hypothetical protein